MRDTKKAKLNLRRETLRALAKDSLYDVAGGALPRLPQNSLACFTKFTKQIGDTIARSVANCPTVKCLSINNICA